MAIGYLYSNIKISILFCASLNVCTLILAMYSLSAFSRYFFTSSTRSFLPISSSSSQRKAGFSNVITSAM